MLKSRKELTALSESLLVKELAEAADTFRNREYCLRVAEVLHEKMFNTKIEIGQADPVLRVLDLVLQNWDKFESLPMKDASTFKSLRARYFQTLNQPVSLKQSIIDSLGVSDYEDKVGFLGENPKKPYKP